MEYWGRTHVDKFDLPRAAVGLGLYGGSREREVMDESQELERQACALVKQYGMVLAMAPPVKAFFKRLAVFMKWSTLEKSL
jgi:hypothetical protein